MYKSACIFGGKPREECAVFGVSLKNNEAVGVTYNGLLSLQHRGQQGAGIAAVSGGKIFCHRGVGLVTEVFTSRDLDGMPPSGVAVGHTRYSKTGRVNEEDMGPVVTEYFIGRIAVAHNGGILNAEEIRDRLSVYGLVFHSDNDDEVISSLIAHYIIKERDPVKGVLKATGYLRGAYSLVIATGNGTLIAVRDPDGFRPLCVGHSEYGLAVASESSALEVCGFSSIRDVEPGEILVAEGGSIVHRDLSLAGQRIGGGLCVFEYVYFARPDSLIDGLSVYAARFRMGEILAEEHPVEADVVCGVPDSGMDAARGYSARSGIPPVLGFMMNRYVGRSFIYPVQDQRENIVRLKLNPLSHNVSGRRVIVIDDSLVRGTTTGHFVTALKWAGAREVHVMISSPPVRSACHFGTDFADEESLIINQMDINGIRGKIGADSLGYLSIDGLKRACAQCRLSCCTACYAEHNS